MAIRVQFGKPTGLASVEQQVMEHVADAVAKATINRVRRRISDHPSGVQAGAGMSVDNASDRSVTIVSQKGNPGIIPARRINGVSVWGKRALSWPGARNPVKFVKNYKGLAPLIEAEAERVQSGEVPLNVAIR